MRGDKVVVYVPIVADLFHVGHRRILKRARELGDIVVAGVVTDEGLRGYKRDAVIPFDERAEIVGDYADVVVSQDGQDPTENLKADPSIDILIHGDDWPENYPAFEYMRSVGKRVVRTRYHEGQSSTKIIEKIKRGE